MRYYRLPRLLILLLALWLSTAICTPSFAGDIALLSIGPRIGFGEKVPFMGKEQKYYFHLDRRRGAHQAPLVLAAR